MKTILRLVKMFLTLDITTTTGGVIESNFYLALGITFLEVGVILLVLCIIGEI